MKYRLAAAIWAFAVCSNATAQVASLFVKGVVRENTFDGKGMERAAVAADPPGSPVITGSDGTFTLEFPRSRPGASVTITVEKRDPATREEYVVVNDVQLKTFLPAPEKANDPKRAMTFVVCRKRWREAYARLFYKLKSQEAIDADSNRRLAPVIAEKGRLQQELQSAASRQEELDARIRQQNDQMAAERERLQLELQAAVRQQEALATKIREQDNQIARLQRERVDAENAASIMSEQLAASTAAQSSERYQEAMRLILDGDVEGALGVLDHAAILRKAQDANRIIVAGQDQRKQATDEFLLRAAALMTRLRFDEAEAEYQTAIREAPFSFDANYRYGQMERVLDRQDKAIELFETSRKIADLTGNRRGAGLALTALGNTYADKKDYKEALAYHKDAVDGYEALVKQDAATYDPLLVGALINEGIAERRLNHADNADKLFTRALGMVKDRCDPKVPHTLELLASVNGNLGNLRKDQDIPQESYDFYKAAISAHRQLVEINASEYEAGLAQTENNLGVFADDASRRVADAADRRLLYAEALQNLLAALKIREKLAARIPEIYEQDYAQTLTNLGSLYGARQQFAEAKQSLEKAVSIRRGLVERSPDAHRAEYANSLDMLGKILMTQYAVTHDPDLQDQAASNFRMAVQINTDGAEKNPAGFAVALGETRTDLAELYATQARWDDARQEIEGALAAYDKADNGITAYPRFHTWSRMGYYRLHQGQRAGAIDAFEKAQSYLEHFSPQEKQVHKREVLGTASTLMALKTTRQ
jgi:tetratricopeptide (TPR) repeat protein